MQERIVLWGNAGTPARNVLVAIALRLQDRVVDIMLFDKDSLPTGFHSDMTKKWVEGEEVALPEGYDHRMQPLNDQSVLPADVRVEKLESIRKLQNEWAYEILAQKTYESFKTELAKLKINIEAASEYKNDLWEQAKSIWDRVLRLRNDNMMRKQYAEELRDEVNILFDILKKQRDENSKNIEQQSAVLLVELREQINAINIKIETSKNLGDVFNELRQYQEKTKNARLVIVHRKELWAAIDEAFETLKGKRGESKNNFMSGRIEGLKLVVSKMEKGLARDKQDLNFQFRRNNDQGASQLEMQLRKAKVQVLEDTIKSKEEKLADIYKTINELEAKSAKVEAKKVKIIPQPVASKNSLDTTNTPTSHTISDTEKHTIAESENTSEVQHDIATEQLIISGEKTIETVAEDATQLAENSLVDSTIAATNVETTVVDLETTLVASEDNTTSHPTDASEIIDVTEPTEFAEPKQPAATHATTEITDASEIIDTTEATEAEASHVSNVLVEDNQHLQTNDSVADASEVEDSKG